MEHTHNHESPSFWVVTTIAMVVTAVIIFLFVWFVYIGHEPLEPIHDDNPHAALTKTHQNIRA
ncbi:MAG: hypothetical protein ABL959_13270 [Pyrinomonadaceae bacterium]